MLRPDSFRKLALPAVLTALGLLLIGALALRFKPVSALTRRVDRGPVRLEIRGTGTLEGVQEVPVAFRVGGRIVELPFDEGAAVREGQVLGRLDPAEAQRALDVAQANQAFSVTGVSRAQAELEHAEAVLEKARTDLERTKSLAAQGILSRADLDAAVERARVAEAQAKAARDARRQAVDSVQVALAGTAVQQRTLDENLLRAPMDGLLVKRLREPGHVVAAGTPIYTLVSTRKFWLRAWVDETALGFLAPGQEARVAFRSLPGRTFTGRVDRVGRTVDQQTHELLVDIELLELPPRFAVGQRADAVIHLDEAAALRVPRTYAPGSGAALWVARNGRAAAVPVRLGRIGEDYIEVLEGLEEGDRVIRRAMGTFREGQRVSLREDAS